MRKNKLFKFILLCLIVLVVFLFLELFVRFLIPQRANVSSPIYSYHEILGWKLIPNTTSSYKYDKVEVIVNVNEEGFRDDSFIKRNKKILFFGDSFVFGYLIEQDKTLSEQLESKLEGYSVFNLGQNGYSTDQELLLYQNYFVNNSASSVFLFLYSNDFEGNVKQFMYQKSKPLYSLNNKILSLSSYPNKSIGLINSIKGFLASHSHFAIFVKRILRSFSSFDYTRDSNSINTTCSLINEFKKSSSSNGAPFYLVLIPNKASLSSNLSTYDPSFYECLDSYSISYLDLKTEFSKRNLTVSDLYFPRDQHFNVFGNQKTSEIIYETLFSK